MKSICDYATVLALACAGCSESPRTQAASSPPEDGPATTAANGPATTAASVAPRRLGIASRDVAPGAALHIDGDVTALGAVLPLPRSCDERVGTGSFSGLVNLTALNTAGDEQSLSLSADGKLLFFLRGGKPFVATLSSPKEAGVPTAIVIANGPALLTGASVTSDGSFWFGGTSTSTALYRATGTLPNLDALASALPLAPSCPFFDPVFAEADASKELYLSYPLAGCNQPEGRGNAIVVGSNGKQLGAFVMAFAGYGYRFPFPLPGGLTLLAATTGPSGRLFYATRASTDTQWSATVPLPLGDFGPPADADVQAIVSPDCSTLYLAARRTGGIGGIDLWAADIATN